MAEIYKSKFPGQEIDERLELIPELQEGVEAAQQAADEKYTKPASGIPMTDLSDEVKEAIEEGGGQADWAQTDTTAPDYIKNKPSIPTNVVRFVQQFLSDSERIQARANIGAGTYTKPSEGIPASDLADDVIPDVSEFITASVNNLVNYYLKSETYSRSEVQQLIAAIQGVSFVSVASLPTPSADTMGGKIYLVPSTNPDEQNVKDEFITIQDGSTYAWEQIGSTKVNLSGYVTLQQLNTALAAYTTTEALTTLLAAKQDTISDLSAIRSGAGAGATAYQKPQTGIPASDLAPGVIPTVPTDVVKYSSQSLTDAQKAQARTNIGAAAASALTALETAIAAKYTKPSSGIPETDLAANVQSALALARTSIQSLADYYDKTEIDSLLAAVSSEQYVDVTTLPTASASTLGKIYLVGPTNGVYDRYYTSYDGTTYSWVGVGTTEINLANYATKEELSQLSQETTIISALSPQRIKSPVTMAGYSLISYVITEDGVWGTQSDQKHILIPVTPGEIYEIVAKTTNQSIIALLTSSSVTSGAAAPFVSGTSRIWIDAGKSKILVIPETCMFLYVYEGYNARTYQPQAINRIYDMDTIVPADTHPYPFESGTISGIRAGSYLTKSDNVARIRVVVPVENVAALRIVKSGWGLVTWAAYDGDIPTANRKGESPSTRAQSFDIAGVIADSTLSFTPKFLIFVIAKDDNSDISGITSIDDIVAIDTIDKSLFGREIVVMGDSSCDPVHRDCWARVLQRRVNFMGISGFFTGISSSGWSTDITTPNVLGQWDGIKEQLTSSHPIVIITSGGNELNNLQLTYDETIALCETNISTPATPAEWAVHTLRTILADKPTVRMYLVSNFYARSSTAGQDTKRRNYREMLRALCDYFSISLIDLTRNSQIRGYMESDSASPGYHIYTDDGVHATTSTGRYLIYHKIMAFVSNNEKYDV